MTTELASIRVEIAYVEAGGQSVPEVRIRALQLTVGTTLGDALVRVGDPALEAAIASGALVPALFGERVQSTYVLHDGDRIELLGPLVADPKLSRGRRAEVQRARQGDARWTRR
jgi:putative ubiquitin-RnfH superfamily antitoxin RatB of RatAB toxin-antitoxin module